MQSAQPVGTGGPPLNMPRARVNFQERQASLAQTLMSLLLWIGTVAVVGALVWSFTAQNAKLRPLGDCSPCADEFYPVGGAKCPKMCVSSSLNAKIEEHCLDTSMAEIAAGADMSEWTQSLMRTEASRAGASAQRAENSSAAGTLQVRRLSRASLKAAVFERIADSPAVQNKNMMQLLASPFLLPALLPILLVVASLWFALLRNAPHCVMWTTEILFVAGLLYGYYLIHNWMTLVLAGLFALFLWSSFKDINQGCVCLQGGLRAFAESRMSLGVVIAISLIMLIYTAVLIAMLVFTSQIIDVKVHDDNKCSLEPVSTQMSIVFVVLFLLTSNFFTMATSFSIAFAIGCWYFHQNDPAAPSIPMLTGMRMSLFSRNGAGVCAQAAIVMTLVEYMEKKVKKTKCPCMDPLWCLLTAMYICFQQCLQALCSFAVAAIALEGGSFCQTSRLAKDAIGPQGIANFLVIESSLTWLLQVQAHTLSTVFGIVALAVIDSAENLGILNAIFKGVDEAGGTDVKGAQWIIVGVVILFYWLMSRPLMTLTCIVLINIYLGAYIQTTLVNSIFAALIVGCIGSLVFHQFSNAASGALNAMLYCWNLDKVNGDQAGDERCRTQVGQLMDGALELQPSQAQQALRGVPRVHEVQCPPGVAPGHDIEVRLPNGQLVLAKVPDGVQQGQFFQITIPDGAQSLAPSGTCPNNEC